MVQLLVQYNRAENSAHFQEYYFGTHVPIAKQIPGLKWYNVSDGAVTGADGSPSPYELIAQLLFDSPEDLQAGLASAEGQAAVKDLENFATAGVNIVVFTVRGL